jgi:predicted hotdog family 3-hydroxylacyl-ACP dehydratase
MGGDTRRYLEAVYGATVGQAHLEIGRHPYIDGNGKYKHDKWEAGHVFAWPAAGDDLVNAIADAAGSGLPVDVYVCPYLMHGRKRAAGAAVPRPIIKADVDSGELTAEQVRGLRAWAVSSGTPGNGHVYINLAEPVTASEHEALCRGLGRLLGAKDSKISDNDVLRPPGTFNYKAAVAGGEPSPVGFLVEPSGYEWPVAALAAALGVDLATGPTGEAAKKVTAPVGPAEPVENIPPLVKKALSRNSGDRSADMFAIVGACRDAGLTLGQARTVVNLRPDLAERLAGRTDDDVQRTWGRVKDPYGQVYEFTQPRERDTPVQSEPEPPDDLFARLVADEARKIRVREAARALVAEETRPPAEPFDAGTLAEILARPDEPPARIEGLLPWDASMLLTARRKTGKTTLLANMARSLLTGEDFLGRFGVIPLDGEIAFLNYEVPGKQVARWLAAVGVPKDRLYMINLRGRRNPLGHPEDRERLAATLRARGTETLICDPFGQAYTGEGQNDPGEVGAWLRRLDAFARGDVGVRDLILTAHAGWVGERVRGSSALEDWADSIVHMRHEKDDDPHSPRYLRAIGRDVEVDEDRLDYDYMTRALTLAGVGSQKQVQVAAKIDALALTVKKVIEKTPGISGYKVTIALHEDGVPFRKGEELTALKLLEDRGEVDVMPGPRKSKCYSIKPPPPTSPPPTPGVGHSHLPPPPLKGGGERGVGRNGYDKRGEVSPDDEDQADEPAVLHWPDTHRALVRGDLCPKPDCTNPLLSPKDLARRHCADHIPPTRHVAQVNGTRSEREGQIRTGIYR